jgi:hypothetical protein
MAVKIDFLPWKKIFHDILYFILTVLRFCMTLQSSPAGSGNQSIQVIEIRIGSVTLFFLCAIFVQKLWNRINLDSLRIFRKTKHVFGTRSERMSDVHELRNLLVGTFWKSCFRRVWSPDKYFVRWWSVLLGLAGQFHPILDDFINTSLRRGIKETSQI